VAARGLRPGPQRDPGVQVTEEISRPRPLTEPGPIYDLNVTAFERDYPDLVLTLWLQGAWVRSPPPQARHTRDRNGHDPGRAGRGDRLRPA
jgi:hypothetical protein